MTMTMTIRVALKLAAVFMLFTAPLGANEEQAKEETESDQRAEIENRVQSYEAAYNAKDAQALSAHWTPDGAYIDRASGQRIVGRSSLEKAFQTEFESQPKSRLDVDVESIEFVSPNVAMEQGTSTLSNPDGEPMASSYSAVHVKRDGQWLIDRVSEQEIVTPPSHYENLKELEWMIGEWTDHAGEGSVSTECHWARNNNFIIRSFTVSVAGGVEMAGMQIIGWDPAQKQIRSWTFDSDGGFNQGVWSKVGESWSVQTTATLPDGTLASSTSLLKPSDENTFTWQQVNRIAGGQLLPNLEEVAVERKAAR
jgi:uncharacterized protein (TIGR02246 family)